MLWHDPGRQGVAASHGSFQGLMEVGVTLKLQCQLSSS